MGFLVAGSEFESCVKIYIYIYNKRWEILLETCDGKMTGLNLLRINRYRLFIIETRYPREIFYPYVVKRRGNLYIWRDDVGFCLFTRWLSGRIKFIGLNLIFERNFFITIRIESKAPRDFSDLTVKQTNFYANFKISLQLLPHFMVIWFNGN